MWISNIWLLALIVCQLSSEEIIAKTQDEESFAEKLQKFKNRQAVSKRGYKHQKEIIDNKNINVDRGKRKFCPGGRVRKEIRRMTPQEWKAFTDAINVLKQTGEYEKMAAIHRGEERINSAHFGPNFLGWHRVYLLCLESLLRRVDPCITIPYWDSTLDYAMKNPTKSILWTDQFLGNGFDNVISGPFKNWVTGQGQNLTRSLATEGRLISIDIMNNVLSKESHSQITVFKDSPDSLEFSHNLLHSWVGGQMGCFPSAAEDPTFFTVHAFIDCWWQRFRNNIFKKYGIKAFNDYPNVTGVHASVSLMEPFKSVEPFLGFKNRDGYKDDLKIYECEDFPSCSRSEPDCKSPYLYCDLNKEQCVSIEAKGTSNSENSEYRNDFLYLLSPMYQDVMRSCNVKYGTTKLSEVIALGFPTEHLPTLKISEIDNLESLLRRVDPCVTIPYWDSTLDYAMSDPTKSILWTDQLLGNGFDNVTCGPFKNWVTGQGQNLTRSIGEGGLLLSIDIRNHVLSLQNHSQITVFGDSPDSLEFAHNLLHSWVGGQMGCFPSAAEDPTFWTVHAFIDCWWEKFKINIFKKYGIKAFNDYPNVTGVHASVSLMEPFKSVEPFLGFKNIDGYKDDLKIYECEDFPSCSTSDPDCKSPYLYCDLDREQCVSIEAMETSDSENDFAYLNHPAYVDVMRACEVTDGTTEISVVKALGFPMEHLPKLKKYKVE